MKLGIYKHFKGNLYEVLLVATHSETREELVIYKPLYKSDNGELITYARPKSMFLETVKNPTGEEVPRFEPQ